MDNLSESFVQPFYLQMMRTNATTCEDDLFEGISQAASVASADDVIALLRDPWRATVMGAWLSVVHRDDRVTAEVMLALARSQGSLTAPPLAVAAVVLAGQDALPALEEYARLDVRQGLGAGGFVAAAIEHLGVSTDACTPSAEDHDDFAKLLALANRLTAAA